MSSVGFGPALRKTDTSSKNSLAATFPQRTLSELWRTPLPSIWRLQGQTRTATSLHADQVTMCLAVGQPQAGRQQDDDGVPVACVAPP